MNVALTDHFQNLIRSLIASGRYNNASEVVRAGLRLLDQEEQSAAGLSYPPGALKHLYTRRNNQEERRTARASTLKVEPE